MSEKGFVKVVANKLELKQLLRSPEMERAEGRVPNLPPRP